MAASEVEQKKNTTTATGVYQ